MKEYQKCFRESKKETLASLGERALEVSEVYIFGKSEAFCKRLEKVSILGAVIIGKEVSLQRAFYKEQRNWILANIHSLNHPLKESVALC